MHNRYSQVALTYVRSPFSSWKMGVLFVCSFLMTGFCIPACRSNGKNVFLCPELFPFALLSVFLVVHAKEQFVDCRAHLMPDFRRIHGAVAALASLICAVALPAAFALCLGWSVVAFVAMTVVMFAAIVWGVLTLSGWVLIPAVVVWFALLVPPGQMLGQELVSGQCDAVAVVLLALGAVATLAGGVRFFQLNEEMPEYRWIRFNRSTGMANVVGMQQPESLAGRRWKYRNADSQTVLAIRHARRAAESAWSRMRRWQTGMMTGWSAFWCGAVCIGVFLAITWLTSGIRREPSLVLPTAFTAIMPALFVGLGLWRRKSFDIARESLMAVDRAAYFREVGLAAMLTQLQFWTPMAALVTVLGLCTLGPLTPHSVATDACLLAVSALSQPWLFGLTVWLLRFRSPLPAAVGGFLAFEVCVTGLLLIVGPIQEGWIVLFVMAVFAVAGLVLAWDAYRRWLSVEIG